MFLSESDFLQVLVCGENTTVSTVWGEGREVPVGLAVKKDPFKNVNGGLALRDKEAFDW